MQSITVQSHVGEDGILRLQIPVGVNRCWVKTVEKGTFPDTRRFFFPVLCNQCDEAPCAKICPTNALFKRPDGIVDLDRPHRRLTRILGLQSVDVAMRGHAA